MNAAQCFSECRSRLQSPRPITFATFLDELERHASLLSQGEVQRLMLDYMAPLEQLCAQRFQPYARRVKYRKLLKGRYPLSACLIMHLEVDYDDVFTMGNQDRDSLSLDRYELGSIEALSFHSLSANALKEWMPFFELYFPNANTLSLRFDYTMSATFEAGSSALDVIVSPHRRDSLRRLCVHPGEGFDFGRGVLVALCELVSSCVNLESLVYASSFELEEFEALIHGLPETLNTLAVQLDIAPVHEPAFLKLFERAQLHTLTHLYLDGLSPTLQEALSEHLVGSPIHKIIDTVTPVRYTIDRMIGMA